MSKSTFGLSLLGAVFIAASSGSAQTTPFAQTTVDGIEVAVGGKVRVRETSFLSNDVLCGMFYNSRADLEQRLKDLMAGVNASGLLPDGVAIVRQKVRLSGECKASVSVQPGQLNLVVELPKNLILFNITTPTPLGQNADPTLSVDFDVRASAQIILPTTAKSGLTLGPADARIFNIHPDSQNLTGDVIFAVVDVVSMILDRDLIGEWTKDQYFKFNGVRAKLPDLCKIVGPGCDQFKLTANYAPNNLLRIDLDGPSITEIISNNPALVTSLGNQGDLAGVVQSVDAGKAMVAAGSMQCASGYVWRVARPQDVVCVTPESRDRVALENISPEDRWVADGASGPNTCISGLVWRQAYEGDAICVAPEIRAAVNEENQMAASRRIGG